MNADVKTEREAQMERYIYRCALGIFLHSLARPSYVGQDERPAFESNELVAQGDDLENLATSLSAPLFAELWPDEDYEETVEDALATGRVYLQVAHIFSRLAEAGPFLRSQADVFRLRASEELLSAQEYVAAEQGG